MPLLVELPARLLGESLALPDRNVSLTERHHQRLYQEALTCSRLYGNDKSFVSFIGVCSTREHPFALVFKFMDHLNLRVYLRDNQGVGRLELVCFH